jgi:hypothetical protein
VLLIPMYGATGAAVAYGLAISTRYLFSALMVFRSLGITLFGPLEIINYTSRNLKVQNLNIFKDN